MLGHHHGRTHHDLLADTVANVDGQTGGLHPVLQVGDHQGGVELHHILFVLKTRSVCWFLLMARLKIKFLLYKSKSKVHFIVSFRGLLRMFCSFCWEFFNSGFWNLVLWKNLVLMKNTYYVISIQYGILTLFSRAEALKLFSREPAMTVRG